MSTIIGTNKKNVESKSFLLQVRFGAPDAKVSLLRYLAKNPLLAKTPMKKNLVKEIFFNDPLCHLPRKGVEPLAEFLFQQALKMNYIVSVPKIWFDDEQEFVVSPSLGDNKPGPRKKKA